MQRRHQPKAVGVAPLQGIWKKGRPDQANVNRSESAILGELAAKRVEFGRRLSNADAVGQPTRNRRAPFGVVKDVVGTEQRHCPNGNPQILSIQRRSVEPGCGNAHNRESNIVKGNRTADDVGSGTESRPPRAVAQDDNRVVAVGFLIVAESGTAAHCDAQHVKIVRRHEVDAHILIVELQRASFAQAIETTCGDEPGQRSAVLHKVVAFSERERRAGVLIHQRDHALWILHRPGAPHECVERRKQAGVESDSAPQGNERHERERRLPSQAAERVDDVLPDALQPGPHPDGAGILTCERRVAKRPAAGGGRIGFRDSLANELPLPLGAVELQFLAKLRLQTLAAQQGAQAAEEFRHRRQANCRTR